MPADILEFGEFELDCDRFELRRKGHRLRLERKPLELLILLASSGGRLVTRAEIARCLWPTEVFVDTEHGINTAIRKIRHALRDDPNSPRFLETITGKGYRFNGVTSRPATATTADPVATSVPAASVPAASVPVSAVPAPSTAAPVSGRHWLVAFIAAAFLLLLAVFTIGTRRVRGHAAPPPIDPAARDAYLHGHYLWFSHNSAASGPYFLKATQLAPNYAPAWAGLADYYGAELVDGDLDPRQNLSLEDAAAHRAIQLDDSLPEAHLAIGASDWIVDWNYPAALHEIDRALQLDPKFAEAHHLRAKLLGQLNRHQEALAEERTAMELSPFQRSWGLAYFLLLARHFDAAITEAQQRLQADRDPITWSVLSGAYQAKGMDDDAERALEQSWTLFGDRAGALALHRAFRHGGAREVLQWRLARLQSQSRQHYVSPVLLAAFYARLGNRPQALAALDEAVRQHSPQLFDIQNNTAFDSLHADPHYRAIVHRIGLPPAW